MTRFWIAQVIRPDGTVLTECVSPEDFGPRLYYPDPSVGQDPIFGPAYGRWRLSDASEWRVTYWWPNGPSSLPAFWDLTGEGSFLSADPDAPTLHVLRPEAAQQLRGLT